MHLLFYKYVGATVCLAILGFANMVKTAFEEALWVCLNHIVGLTSVDSHH